jgi:hypothetical protein
VVEAFGVVKLWRTLLFAAVALALGAYIWLVEKPRMAAEAEPDKLVKIDTEKAARVRLKYADSTITLEKKDKHWHITEPIQADADDGTVDRLLQQVADTKAERRIAAKDAEPLATYGLDGDGKQARISIKLDDGTDAPDIVVGNTTPVGYQAFVRVEGRDEIVVVPLLLHSGIKKTVFDLRDKKLFDVDAAHGVALTLTRESGPIVLVRDGDRWKITAPTQTEADPEQVRTLLRSLNDVTALAFYEGAEIDRAKFGLDKPALEVQAEFGDKGMAGFRLGAKAPDAPDGFYVERIGDGEVAKIPAWVRNRFDQDLNALRDKNLFNCEAANVGKVSYDRADGTSFVLTKKDGKWTMEPAPERPLNDSVVERTVGGLATLAGKEIVAEDANTTEKLAPYALDVPVAQVEVSREDGTSCGRALAGVVGAGTDGAAYYLKRSDGVTVMSVPQYIFARVDMKRDDFVVAPKEAPVPAGNAATPPAAPPQPESSPPPQH